MINWMFEVEDVASLVDDMEKVLELHRARRGIVHPNNISRNFPQISLIFFSCTSDVL
jgi:hypothetical protein